MCNQSVDNYPHTLEFVPECFVTQRMCDKAVDTYPSKIKFVPEEICDKAVNGPILNQNIYSRNTLFNHLFWLKKILLVPMFWFR